MVTGFKIGERKVGVFLNPYIIAEIGVNHEGSIKLAKRMIREATEGGAHAVKFQSYKAEKIASRNSPAYWDRSKEPTDSQFNLFKKYDAFGPQEYADLSRYCLEYGIDFLSTPFDLEAVDFLEPLVPAFKIASADITNVPLLRKVGFTGKPIILSTGAATLPEIEFAVSELRRSGTNKVALLHCVLNYPTPLEHAQLGMIRKLGRVFPGCPVGYSDHIVPDATLSALECAAMLGACILEKHFTYDKRLPGNDHYHAMDKDDLIRFIEKQATYRRMMGKGETKDIGLELEARRHARRSIVAAVDIRAGDMLTEKNLIAKRPAHGISPLHWDYVIGRVAIKDICEDTLLTWDLFS